MCNIEAARPTFSNRWRTSELRYSISVRSSSSTSFKWDELLTSETGGESTGDSTGVNCSGKISEQALSLRFGSKYAK